jgi:predicted dehydrogenase
MVASARKHNLALMEGFMFQYHRQHQTVFDLLRSGAVGDVRHFFSSFGFPPLTGDNFRYDEQIGGGALLDAAGYTIRAVHFMLGRDFRVKGATLYSDPGLGTSIYGSAFLTNTRGIGASVAFGFDNYYQCRYEIWGTKGKLIADRAFTPTPEFSPKIIVETAEGTNVLQVSPDNHFINAFREFHRTILNNSDKQRHYADILLQSESLDLVRTLSGGV